MAVSKEEINVTFSASSTSATQPDTIETRIELEPIRHLLRRVNSVEEFIRKTIHPMFGDRPVKYVKTETDITGKKVIYTLHYQLEDVTHLVIVGVEES